MKLFNFLDESFQHYTVKHKQTGKTYKVTAMHKNSALDKARVQHGGTASRYTGTSSSRRWKQPELKQTPFKKKQINEGTTISSRYSTKRFGSSSGTTWS